MKKIVSILLVLFFTIMVFVPTYNTNAATLKGYREELANLKKEKADAEKNKEQIEASIAKANEEIRQITVALSEIAEKQKQTEDEIQQLETKIADKKQQIKDLVAFYQVSNSENFYLKYIFGSESFTDFIYRFSVIDQLTTRNDELVDEMNNLIVENENKVKELESEKEQKKKLEQEVRNKLSTYASQKTAFSETSMDLDTQIQKVEEKIKRYEDAGCGETQNLSTCMSSIPFDYGFNKPLKTGYINDEFGMRLHPVTGVWKNHNGIDIGGNREGTPVYAAAAGKVVDVMHGYYCGGNIVTINHIIDGKPYTTRYWHMLYTTVSEGDIVEKGEQVGVVGGGSTSYINGGYDQCTTGTHLHFEMAYGHYYGVGDNSYSSWSTYLKKVFDPREMVYFPAYGVRW